MWFFPLTRFFLSTVSKNSIRGGPLVYILSSTQFQIPQIVGFSCTRKHTKWGICSNNLRSEEYSVFISSSDSSHCRILMHQKTYRVRSFFDFLQSEESSEFNSVSDSSDCRIWNIIKAKKWGILKNERLASRFFSLR